MSSRAIVVLFESTPLIQTLLFSFRVHLQIRELKMKEFSSILMKLKLILIFLPFCDPAVMAVTVTVNAVTTNDLKQLLELNQG